MDEATSNVTGNASLGSAPMLLNPFNLKKFDEAGAPRDRSLNVYIFYYLIVAEINFSVAAHLNKNMTYHTMYMSYKGKF